MVAVTKNVPADVIREAVSLGLRDLGENRAQELGRKLPELAGSGITWHFIGHLQTNKVKYVVMPCEWLHSLDRLSLAREVSSRALRAGTRMKCLVQVNVSGELSKYGLDPKKVEDFLWAAGELPGLEIWGLMTMAPWTENPEAARPVFSYLRELRDRLQARLGGAIPGLRLEHLSMGMTEDYPVAVEEGATMVRIGRALFSEKELRN